MNRETFRLILTEELRMGKVCAKMVPRNLTEQQRDAWLRSVFDIHMHYGDAATSWLTWSRTLRLLFISESKIGSETTTFCANRRHPDGCTACLKRHTKSFVPGMLQTMAVLLGKLCAGTRDVLWRWPHCSWWINKVHFLGTSIIILLSDLVQIQRLQICVAKHLSRRTNT